LHQILETLKFKKNKVMVISKKPLHFIVALLVAFMPLFTFANPTNDSTKVEAHAVEATHEKTEAHAEAAHEGEAHAEPTDIKSKIKEFINHHLLDSHSFYFNGDEESGKHYGFSLPVILWDNGLQVFSSAKFHNGEEVAENNGNFYVLHHEKIYKTDATGKLTEEHGHPTNVRPLDLSITKSVIGILLVAILVFVVYRFSKIIC
jgi:F-type H+-transporting ATPase subunit a